ncbi:hypothetical protein COO91_05532 [Nostoc flagelliforme CCNUN1]|uniref:Uncharacterized protein n=1 Tax=Nostoc flagelliforme CCNUN1 TaxID=2038116 RepID=A0A2K8SVR1_9NOSO|nr:hypothetical protein COO91_05532 [Nostoc flagelliforme CCNUN1]
MSKPNGILSKPNGILLTKFGFIYFPDAVISYSHSKNLK